MTTKMIRGQQVRYTTGILNGQTGKVLSGDIIAGELVLTVRDETGQIRRWAARHCDPVREPLPKHLEHLRIDHPIEHICDDCGERTIVTPDAVDAFLAEPVFCCAGCKVHEIPMAALGGITVAGDDPIEGVCANCAAIQRSQGR